MSDDNKKPGFFKRLFGRKGKDEAGAFEVETPQTPVEAPKPKPEQKKPAPKTKPKHEVSEAKVPPKEAPKPAAKPKSSAKAKPAAKKTAAKKPAVKKPAPKAEPKAKTKPKSSPKPRKAKPEPKPVAAPIPEPEEDLHHADPGPPETQPEWIEEHEQVAASSRPGAVAETEAKPEKKKSWFQRLTTGLKRSSDQLTENITTVFTKRKLDQATLDDLEDILIQADLGIDTAMAITEALAKDRFDKEIAASDVREVLADEVNRVLEPVAQPLEIEADKKPFVILMVGVNGSGKTTTIGKLAQKLKDDGKSVMLAAGDTFRAAAVEQLQVWGERTGAPVVTRPTGADASGLAFDAVTEAKVAGKDVLIIDTAGRLQNRDELMAELEKIIRVIKKVDDTAPHRVLLTLDATTGQNALNQVDIFGKRAGVTGLVMTKLDGTARGGILVAIAQKFGLPVHFIGVGEGVDDLESFAAKEFAQAIAGQE